MRQFLLLSLLTFMVSCEEIIAIPDISDATVETLAPSNNSNLSSEAVVFSWNQLEDAESYRIQVAQPSFESAVQVVLDSLVTSNNFQKTLDSGNYEWRVRAENAGYATSFSTNSFTVNSETIDISNEQVELLSPGGGLVFSETDIINFSWSPVNGATSYNLQIATPNFTQTIEIVEDINQSENSFSISSLDIADYEWRVRAINSEFQTEYTTQNFSVEE